MDIPMPPVVQPRGLMEYANEASNFRNSQQQNQLNNLKLQYAPQQMEMQQRAAQQGLQQDEQAMNVQKQAALQGLATDFKARLQSAKISDPDQAQQYLDQYVQSRAPYIKSMGFPMTDRFTVDQVMQLAGPTAQEQQQSKIAGLVAEQQALAPGKIAEKQAEASIGIAKEGRDFNKALALEQAKAGMQAPQQNAKLEMDLADDWWTESKDYKTASEAAKKVNTLLDKASTSPAATLAGATAFMKQLDPGSVVRESELGMAMNAQGQIDRLGNYVNILANGQVLTPNQVKDFKNAAQAVEKASSETQRQVDANYSERAKNYGLNPKNIIRQFGQNKPSNGGMTNVFDNKSNIVQADTGNKPVGSTAIGSDGRKYKVVAPNQVEVIE